MKKLFISVLIGLIALISLPQTTKAQGFGKNMTMYRHVEWKIYETEHFKIYFDVPDWKNLTGGEQEKYLKDMKGYLETAYAKISQAIAYEMPIGKKKFGHGKPKIFFFWSRYEFEQHPLGGFNSGIAYAEPLKMRMICVKSEYPPEKIQQLVTHEVCHLFQFSLWNLAEKSSMQLSRIWQRLLTFLFEGFSQHVSGLHRTEPNARLITKYFLQYKVLNFLDVKDWIMFHNAYEVAYILAGYLYDYIHEKYGDDTFRNFVKEFRRAKPTATGFEKVINQVLYTDFTELDRGFKEYLNNLYGNFYIEKKEAYKYGRDILAQRELRTKDRPDVVYEPVISPSGEMVAAFIFRADNIRLALVDPRDGTIIKELTPGFSLYKYGLWPIIDPDSAGRSLSFSPNNDCIFYFAHTAGKNPVLIVISFTYKQVEKKILGFDDDAGNKKIHDPETGLDVDTGIPKEKVVGKTLGFKVTNKEVEKIEIEFDDPESPEMSKDGKTVIFSAIQNGQRDIFSLNLETKEVKNLTSDEQFDFGPSFAPDEKTIVYVADVSGYKKLFSLNLETQEKKQLTFDLSNEIRPIYSKDGKIIFFISDEENQTKNIYGLDLENNQVTQWTDVINGVRTVVPKDKGLIFGAVGYRDSQHIFSDNLYEMDLEKASPVAIQDDLLKPSQAIQQKTIQFDAEEVDLKKIEKYNPWKNISLVDAMFYGGLDTRFGIYGYGYAYLTDLTYVKHIQANIVSFGDWYKQNSLFYFDLSRRINWGAVISQEDHHFYPWFVDWGYNPYGQPAIDTVLYNLRFKRVRLETVFQYPLDLCHRIEFSLSGTTTKYQHPDWKSYADYYAAAIEGTPLPDDPIWQLYPEGYRDMCLAILTDNKDKSELRADFINKYINDGKFLTFNFAFVRDTALYKYYVGPLTNDMYRVDLSWSTGGHNITVSTEARKYLRLGSEWVFALRGYAGAQLGKTITPWIVGDLGELRGYQWMQFMGNRIWMTNIELRFPLIRNFNLFGAIGFGDIRAALFMDLAKIWFDDKRFNALNKDDVNTGLVKGSIGVDLALGTVPFLGIPLHLAFSKRMVEAKFLPKFEDKWQVKLYFGYSF